MSVLETFYILFKSDAKDVKKGAQEAERSTHNLNKTLERADKKSETVGKSFLSLSHSALSAFASIASVGTVFASLKSAVAGVEDLGRVSRLLNVNAEDLDAWGHAVQRSGGDAKQFQSTLSSLSKTLNATPSTAIKALPAIAESLGRMNQAQADLFGRSLGIDQATIRFLQQGRGEVERIIKKQKELGLITKEDTIATKKFNDAVYDLGRVFNDLSRKVAIPALPVITDSLEYLMTHKDLIKGAFVAIGSGVAFFAARMAVANPYLLAFTSALTAFSVAYEDFKKFRTGGKSVIGEISMTINDAVDKIKQFGENLSPTMKKLTGFGALDPNRKQQMQSSSAFSGFSFKNFFERISGRNALAQNSVNVGDVTINTRATNGQEIAQTFTQELMQQLTQANANFDNGVTI